VYFIAPSFWMRWDLENFCLASLPPWFSRSQPPSYSHESLAPFWQHIIFKPLYEVLLTNKKLYIWLYTFSGVWRYLWTHQQSIYHFQKFPVIILTLNIYSCIQILRTQCSIINYDYYAVEKISQTYLSYISKTLHFLTNTSLFPCPLSPPHLRLPQSHSLLWSVTILDSTWKWNHVLFVLLCLAYCT
jgi:hypothetical protein